MTSSESRTPIAPILIIDDDDGARDTFALALRLEGYQVVTAAEGCEGVSVAQRHRCGLVLVDFHLPDMSGADVIRDLRSSQFEGPIVLVSAYTTLSMVVESMKLGAFEVLEKPVGMERLVRSVRQALAAIAIAKGPRPVDGAAIANRVTSVVDRWSWYIIRAISSPDDLKTLSAWARYVAISTSTLCATCRLIGVRPLDARDFARVIRVLRLAHLHDCRPQVLLNVGDARTLSALSRRAGIDLESRPNATAVEEFLANQRFIPHENEALPSVREFLRSWQACRRQAP